MRLDRAATLLLARAAGALRLHRPAGAIPVLMYHSVSNDDESAVSPYYRLAVSPARFRDHVRLLADGGDNVVGLEQAMEMTADACAGKRQVVITFDDGYVDFMANAWPALEQAGFTATVFLPTGFIATAERRRFKGRECLTWAEVRDLARRGVSFGSHTASHARLADLPWPEVRAELRDSRLRIEHELGTPVTAFAYPFAFPQQNRAFVSRLRAELLGQGYRTNVTTAIGRHAPGSDPLQVKRLPVNGADDLQFFSAKLAGAYDWAGALQSAWKRLR